MDSVRRRYFLVGDNCVLLGEGDGATFTFDIGRTVADIIGTAALHRCAGRTVVSVNLPGMAVYDEDHYDEILALIARLVAHEAGPSVRVEVMPSAADPVSQMTRRYQSSTANSDYTLMKKFDTLPDVYCSALHVPWNFEPIEVDDIWPLLRRTPPRDGLLDIGAGYGKNLWALREQRYALRAIEFSSLAANRANALLGEGSVDIGTVATLPYASGAFSTVLDVGCLHSLPDGVRSLAVREIARVLDEQGVLVSRIFKPRDEAWRRRMPFSCESFGLDLSAVRSLLDPHFQIDVRQVHNDYCLLEATKR